MTDKQIKIISISLPVLLVLLFIMVFKNTQRPNELASNYRQALRMHENFHKSPASVLLSSDVIESQKYDKTKVSYLEVFNDKFSLPQEKLSILLSELENEHKDIIYQHHSNGLKINKVLELNPRYRLVLATFLEIDPSGLTEADIKTAQLNNDEIYLLKAFAKSDDLILILGENKLSKDYLDITNLRRIFGSQHHLERSREISNIE